MRIVEANGMEVHRFGDDGSLGYISRVAPLEDGEIIVMTTLNGKRAYLRCDFRGELIEKLELSGLPAAFSNFEPDQLVYREGRLYFAERGRMRVVVTDVMGVYRQSFALQELVAAAVNAGGEGERKGAAAIDGFNVDSKGNLLFTMSTMFAAGIFTTNGQVKIFGSRGSTPGKFNVIGGIDSDEKGYLFITDRLRSIVSVWTRDLQHLGDFGYRGDHPMSLLTPYEVVVGNGKVFVSQAGKRGVKVFRVNIDEHLPPEEPPPPQPEDSQPPPRRQPPQRGPEVVG